MPIESLAEQFALNGEVSCRIRSNGRRRILVFRNRKMEVAPVDAQIVAGAVEDVLIARPNRENVEP